jgi:hypothetical protein
VTFTALPNTGSERTGTITVAGQTVTVTQATGCVYAVVPLSQTVSDNAGPGAPITVTTLMGCTWTATTSTPWISIQTGQSGTGPGIVTFRVSTNNGSQRTGTMTIAGQTVTVIQQGD